MRWSLRTRRRLAFSGDSGDDIRVSFPQSPVFLDKTEIDAGNLADEAVSADQRAKTPCWTCKKHFCHAIVINGVSGTVKMWQKSRFENALEKPNS